MNDNLRLLKDLWNDECGAVVTSELVLLGTVGVLGATVGLNQVSHAVNAELKDVASALRSLDQSYYVPGHSGCGAWTASSCYKQQAVAKSLEELWKVEEQPAPQVQPRKVKPAPVPAKPEKPISDEEV